jgi:hypothetical protein
MDIRMKSRAESIISWIFRDKNKIESNLKFYIHHRNLYKKGQEESAFFKNMVTFQSMMVTWLFIKSIFPSLPNIIVFAGIPLAIAIRITFNWCVGYWWDKNNIFDRESDWNNVRNPVMNGLDKKILRSEEDAVQI